MRRLDPVYGSQGAAGGAWPAHSRLTTIRTAPHPAPLQAHIQAAEALSPTSPLAGKAYFITNDEDRTFWGFMGDLCHGLGYDRPRIK